MMTRAFLTLTRRLFMGVIVYLSGCDSCGKADCPPPFDVFRFSYLSASQEDLLSGSPPKYVAADIKVFSFFAQANRKEYSEQVNIVTSMTNRPAYAVVYLRTNFSRAYLEIKGVFTDTLDFKFLDHHDTCCGTVNSLEEIKLNGLLQSGNEPVKIIE